MIQLNNFPFCKLIIQIGMNLQQMPEIEIEVEEDSVSS